jgi:beta-lactamase regulating signal transducer with metallopeptidase domain
VNAAHLAGSSAELELLVRATLLIGAAWAAAAGLRRAGASASVRHVAWLLGILALLALPLLWWFAPALLLPILGPEAAGPATAALAPPASLAEPAAPAADDWGWTQLLLGAYAAGALLQLLRIAVFRRMLARLWSDSEAPQDLSWQRLATALSSDIGLSRTVEIRIARVTAMPMTWGTLAPKLLLPPEADEWPAEQRRLVLIHELAHVARRDSLSRSAASLACALYWFHPGVWFAARQMRIEQEHAADDRVLAAGAPAHRYALSLLHLAGRAEDRSRSGHAAAMASMCQLERRLVAITTPARRELPGPALLAAATAVAAGATLLVSAGVPVSTWSTVPTALQAAEPAAIAPAQHATAPQGPFEPQPSGSAGEAAPPAQGGASGDPEGRATAPPTGSANPAVQAEQYVTGRPQEAATSTAVVLLDPRAAIGGNPAQALGQRRQGAAYGPSLPQAPADSDASDARLPVLTDRRGRGDAGTRGSSDRFRLPVRFVAPGMPLNSPSGAAPPSPRLTLSLDSDLR